MDYLHISDLILKLYFFQVFVGVTSPSYGHECPFHSKLSSNFFYRVQISIDFKKIILLCVLSVRAGDHFVSCKGNNSYEKLTKIV